MDNEKFKTKGEFKKHILENYYKHCTNDIFEEMLDNILEYAGSLDELEQYEFLCYMLPIIPEIDIRNTYYSNEEVELEYYE